MPSGTCDCCRYLLCRCFCRTGFCRRLTSLGTCLRLLPPAARTGCRRAPCLLPLPLPATPPLPACLGYWITAGARCHTPYAPRLPPQLPACPFLGLPHARVVRATRCLPLATPCLDAGAAPAFRVHCCGFCLLPCCRACCLALAAAPAALLRWVLPLPAPHDASRRCTAGGFCDAATWGGFSACLCRCHFFLLLPAGSGSCAPAHCLPQDRHRDTTAMGVLFLRSRSSCSPLFTATLPACLSLDAATWRRPHHLPADSCTTTGFRFI